MGATPARQQIAILVGSLSSALCLGLVILMLNDAGTVFARRDYPQVQASILVIALTYIFVNFASDLLYGIVDPRIKLQ